MVHLNHEGHTLVVTTHDVEKVIAHVSRMAILHEGELRELGPPEELVRDCSILASASLLYDFWERERSHGSTDSVSLLSRRFLPSPLGPAMQIPWPSGNHGNACQIRIEWLILDSVLFLGLLLLSRLPLKSFLRGLWRWMIFLLALFLFQVFSTPGTPSPGFHGFR